MKEVKDNASQMSPPNLCIRGCAGRLSLIVGTPEAIRIQIMILIVLGLCYEPHERLQWRKLQRNTLQPPWNAVLKLSNKASQISVL
jgi:hypothetical protein